MDYPESMQHWYIRMAGADQNSLSPDEILAEVSREVTEVVSQEVQGLFVVGLHQGLRHDGGSEIQGLPGQQRK
jgi:hypothetical protein